MLSVAVLCDKLAKPSVGFVYSLFVVDLACTDMPAHPALVLAALELRFLVECLTLNQSLSTVDLLANSWLPTAVVWPARCGL